MTPPESTSIALELAELRRAVDVGNATTQGQLALLVQRTDQTDQKLADHEQRLDTLERNRWPLPTVTALTALGALGVAVWQATGH
ncbi:MULTISPECIES: hypothetical protein [Streptomyces]|uniref:hypothetical protein n=1 Tax=Streptomyces TaxID=1883 RepID=UPI000765A217|nr:MULTISPECIES: hypothetical protein [Streptomyces]MBE4783899.1 hypothetical protein [Streptomyces caniscabiei]MBE4791602.1 hypothetical protein [Streptomyces caniscabiei]MDX3009159.1 hypothetical protein [Streptomyces caniscabiei]MDX3831406.1 hypothetical protein [Streptomyces europaeiscabiei]